MCHWVRPRVGAYSMMLYSGLTPLIIHIMAKIDNIIIQRVLEATDIIDVIGAFTRLRKTGTNYTCHCPFHDDQRDGNFIIRPKHVAKYPNTWHCFVCDDGGDAVKFLMKKEGLSFPDAIRWLARRRGIDVDDRMVNIDIKPYTPPPPPPLMELKRELVRMTMDERTYAKNFLAWLWQLPWNEQQLARFNDVLWKYCVGGWHDGRVVFWMIDHNGIPRAAKLMRYREDGHRDKESHPGWIYNQPGLRDEYDPEGHTIIKPLFGGHLLKHYPAAEVHIVESEKTAIFCAIYFGGMDRHLWLATAGKGNLKRELIQPLIDQRRIIALHPDKDGMDDWNERRKEMAYNRAYINNSILTLQWEEKDGEKADIADVLTRVMDDAQRDRAVKKLSDIIPKIEPATAMALVDNLDLDIIEQGDDGTGQRKI